VSQQFSNAARTELAAGILAGDTTFTLDDGQVFPDANNGNAAIGTGTWFKATLQDVDGIEIVYVRTHNSGTTPDEVSHVLRGQEGTTARAFAAGTAIGLRVTAGDMTGLQTALNGRRALTGSGAPVGTDLNDPNFRVAGDYQLGGVSYTNTPPGVTAEWHLLLVFRADNTCVQLLLAPSNAGGKGYMRTGDYLNHPEASWSAWRDFSLPDMATPEQMQDGVSTAAAGMSPKLVADAMLVPAGTANTLNLAAANKAVPITANTTIPTHASVAYGIGACIVLECGGTARTITGPAPNSLTIDGKSGTVTSFTLKADTSVAIRKTGTNTWRVYGDV
jgi:hypothetical protein